MSDEAPSLDQIGLEFNTDKASSMHGYLAMYERFFSKFRYQKIKILEIGVFGGASLRTWEKYFPEAMIVGADIDVGALNYATDRIKIELMDQSNIQDLIDLGVKHGPFDIIIEDGSHFWEHQITSLRTLFPFLKNGGIYICEDLQTNFGVNVDNYRGIASQSCVEYLKQLVDFRVGDDTVQADVEDAFLRTYGRSMSYITFFRHACLMEKKHTKINYEYQNKTIVEPNVVGMSKKLTVMAHVGGQGDVQGSGGLFVNNKPSERGFIQGFMITGYDGIENYISYRGRLYDGRWTDWVSCNNFVGTKGINQNLTGFAVRLNEDSKNAFNLKVIGAFEGLDDTITVGDGVDCTPVRGMNLLKGIQIILEPI
jgi:ubiquinone/menaquinone biosynthesis C-methylase UbiE